MLNCLHALLIADYHYSKWYYWVFFYKRIKGSCDVLLSAQKRANSFVAVSGEPDTLVYVIIAGIRKDNVEIKLSEKL